MSDLPKPFGTYFYRFPNLSLDVGVQCSEESGWTFYIKVKGKVARMGIGYDAKGKTLDRARVELRDLGWPDEASALENHLSASVYEYPTYPRIKVFTVGSRWGWKCGKQSGIEKTKKMALNKASKCREDE